MDFSAWFFRSWPKMWELLLFLKLFIWWSEGNKVREAAVQRNMQKGEEDNVTCMTMYVCVLAYIHTQLALYFPKGQLRMKIIANIKVLLQSMLLHRHIWLPESEQDNMITILQLPLSKPQKCCTAFQDKLEKNKTHSPLTEQINRKVYNSD